MVLSEKFTPTHVELTQSCANDVVEGCWRLFERPNKALSSLQSYIRAHYPPRRVPELNNPDDATHELYSASIVQDKENHDKPADVVFIFLSGMTGTTPGQTPFGEEIVRAYKKQGKNAVFIGINSSFCMDTTHVVMPQIETRAAHMAALSYEIARQYPDADVFVNGHSLGGMEEVYAAPMIDHLLQTNDNKRLSGTIFTQAGGLFNQNLLSFGRRNMEEQQLRTATDMVFPTIESIAPYERLLKLAQMREDDEEVARLTTYIDYMMNLIGHNEFLQDLTATEKIRYTQIMGNIEVAEKYGATETVKDLLEQRYQLLKIPTLRRMQGHDTRKGNFFKGLRSFIRFAQTGARVPFVLPQYARDTVASPVAYIWGDRDLNFPKVMAQESIKRWEKKHKKKLFPNAPRIFDTSILGWPHAAFADIASYAAYCAELTGKMKDSQSDQQIRFSYPPHT